MRQGGIISPEVEEYFQNQRLDSGLFTLQLVDYIIGVVSKAHSAVRDTAADFSLNQQIRKKVEELLNLQDGSTDDVYAILKGSLCNPPWLSLFLTQGYADSLGSANSEEKTQELKYKILQVAAALKVPRPQM